MIHVQLENRYTATILHAKSFRKTTDVEKRITTWIEKCNEGRDNPLTVIRTEGQAEG